MIRTQIQLPEAEYEALRQAAHRANRSMADCVREAISAYLTRVQPADRILTLAGKYPPKPADDLKDHDRWWGDAILSPRLRCSGCMVVGDPAALQHCLGRSARA